MASYLELALEYLPVLNRIQNFKPKSIKDTIEFAFDPKNRIIVPSQIREEIYNFLTLISRRNIRNVLEIGSANGGTLFMIAKTVRPDSRIISLDFGYTKFAGLLLLAKLILFKSFLKTGKVTVINADSHKDETRIKVIREMHGALDLLFIDGDHSYEGVKKDFEMYQKLVRKGGLIAFHDIMKYTPEYDSGAKRLWGEIKGDYDYIEIIKDTEQDGYGIGIIFKGEDR